MKNNLTNGFRREVDLLRVACHLFEESYCLAMVYQAVQELDSRHLPRAETR